MSCSWYNKAEEAKKKKEAEKSTITKEQAEEANKATTETKTEEQKKEVETLAAVLSTEQIADYLFKKSLGTSFTKTDEASPMGEGFKFFNEPLVSRTAVYGEQIWSKSNEIPYLSISALPSNRSER